MTTAYLVVHMDVTVAPPVAKAAGIYSESARTITGAIGKGLFAFDVLEASGENYEEACAELHAAREFCRGVFDWAFDLLPKSEQPTRAR